jgi:hypothetical protein
MDSYDRFHRISDQDKFALMRIRDIFDMFLAQNHKMPLIYARAFMEVALSPGKGPTMYSATIGTSQPQMSRVLLNIGPRARWVESGMKLIDLAPSPENGRERQAYLTPKGLTLMYDILRRAD